MISINKEDDLSSQNFDKSHDVDIPDWLFNAYIYGLVLVICGLRFSYWYHFNG